MAFFYKMKGAFYRYICECAIDDRLKKVKDEAKKAYDQANEITLQPCTSTKLQAVLNSAVFESEYNNNTQLAVKNCEKILSDAVEKMEELNEDEYKEIDGLIEVLKENVSTWKDKLDNERQNTKIICHV